MSSDLVYEGQGRPKPRHTPPLYQRPQTMEPPEGYLADPALADAVNTALYLAQPLLLAGEPGTGKTQLAHSIAWEFDLPLHLFNTKMNSSGADLFYRYDSLLHFHDSHITSVTPDPRKYITYQALGKAILYTQEPDAMARFVRQGEAWRPTRSVVLVDEIDKAPRDFPNDMLYETERLAFEVRETGWHFEVNRDLPPIVLFTSNGERNLPDAFLRRCVFYFIPFPSKELLHEIVRRRLQPKDSRQNGLFDAGIDRFLELREDKNLLKKPATAEMLSWLKILDRHQFTAEDVRHRPERLAATYPALLKTKEDLQRLQRRAASATG